MKDTYTVRVFVQSKDARNAAGELHKHVVTQVVECGCGCIQEELFPVDCVHTAQERRQPISGEVGLQARSDLGARSVVGRTFNTHDGRPAHARADDY